MGHVDEELIRALLRVARRTAGGDTGRALDLALGAARRDPATEAALHACLRAGTWTRLVREELVGHAAPDRGR